MIDSTERLLIKQQIAASRMTLLLLERYEYKCNEKQSEQLLNTMAENLSRATDNLAKLIHTTQQESTHG